MKENGEHKSNSIQKDTSHERIRFRVQKPHLFCEDGVIDRQFMNMQSTAGPPPGGPTKDEILAISLHKLGLCRSDTFADLGCGTGRVSIEASSLVQCVHAVDRRESACEWKRNEALSRNIQNLTVHQADNASFLSTLETLDTAFVGGSQGLSDVIAALSALRVRTLVINAVMVETVHTAVTSLREHGMFREVVMANIARSHPIGSGIMFKPLDPVYIISGGSPRC